MSCLVLSNYNAKASDRHPIFVVEGKIDYWTHVRLRFALLSTSEDQTVLFKNCHGGQLAVAERVATLIREKKLNTTALGVVSSACQLAFLGGVKRSLSANGAVMMLIHAPTVDGERASQKKLDDFFLTLERLTDGKFPGQYRSHIASSYGEGVGLIFYSTPRNGARIEKIQLCRKSISPEQITCERLGGASLSDVGVTTPD
jgi:hypothetical protein